MASDCRRHLNAAFVHRLHQRKATPRRLGLQTRLKVGWARVQTETALHALVEIILGRRVFGDKPSFGRCRC